MGRGQDVLAFGEEGKAGYGTLYKTLSVYAVQVACDVAAVQHVASALAAVRHPCVLLFLGVHSAVRGSVASHSLVFERAPEGLLCDTLYADAKQQPLAPPQARAIARCVCHAMAYLFESGGAGGAVAEAASRGLVCPDGELLRPDALLVANWAAGHVKLGALTVWERSLLKRRDAPAGRPAPLPYAYYAPEHFGAVQVAAAAPHTTRPQDVFAFGVLLWELAERQPAFAAMRMAAADVADFVLGGERLAFSDAAHPFKAVAEQCWCQEPAARPSFTELVTMLM